MPEDLRDCLSCEAQGITRTYVKLDYDYWSARKLALILPEGNLIIPSLAEILHAILPTTVDEDIPTAFTVTGHIGASASHRYRLTTESIPSIAHLNLREEWLPYKELIGQVILDVGPTSAIWRWLAR